MGLPDLDVSRETSETPGEELPAPLHVCDWVEENGEVCAADFDTASKLNAHKMGKHKRTESMGRGGGRTKNPPKDAPPKRKSAPRVSRASATNKAPFDRPAAYTSGLSTLALGAFLTVPKFDAFDLQAVNAGAPGLANALDAMGEQHKAVREACDLILAGGTGGPYLQLLLAALAIAAPILAHHNLLPQTAGERFGALVGTQMPAPEPAPAPAPEPESPFRDAAPDDPTMFDFLQPPTVSTDAEARMMRGAGPTLVGAPAETNADVRPDPGSEQLSPETVAPQ